MVSTTILSSTTVDCTLIIMFLEQQISILTGILNDSVLREAFSH